jgi:tRNA-splicing ligase RtcB
MNINKIKKEGKMKVPGVIFASPPLFKKIKSDGKTIEQVKNVASLPGIVKNSLAMPDAHQGYGFPIGGVAAFDLDKGVISPGGVGYDINCGVRILTTNITKEQFLKKRKQITEEINNKIPSGVGRESSKRLTDEDITSILETGVNWAIKNKIATNSDKSRIEDKGHLTPADADLVSIKAKARGKRQLGTLGSGNHFIEIQAVESILDKQTAKTFGLKQNQIVIMIHSGSRGLGHQVASDYILKMEKELGHKDLPDRELISAPIKSELGQQYTKAMNAAANFAFVNRQMMTYHLREIFKNQLKAKVEILYDICHNIAKFEKHKIGNKQCELCVHRKGATRSFGPNHKSIPAKYKKTGLPIFLPGSMGTFSYVLSGTKKAEELSFGSAAHGAGRVLSRSFAIKNLKKEKIEKQLLDNDVLLKSHSVKGILEEAPEVYKDVNEVALVSQELGLSNLVARLKPLAVVKG